MVEIGIPVWHARRTLPRALDSIVAQIYKDFSVCLSIDCDGEDYSDIVSEYTRRGLNIRIITADENGGPGIARQRVIDTTQADYLIFLDSDDMLSPRAVQILYTQAREGDYDIIRSSFVREEKLKNDLLMQYNSNTITWFHGKIYKVKFLKDKNIRFLPNLKTDEDAYFNLVAWNSTTNRGELNEVTYYWLFNEASLTRCESNKDFFTKTYTGYITSQVEGLKTLYNLNGEINHGLVTLTLINIYNYYMRARFYKLPEEPMNILISSLKNEKWMQEYLSIGKNWADVIKTIKTGDIFDEVSVVFFNETFNIWANRLLKNNDASV